MSFPSGHSRGDKIDEAYASSFANEVDVNSVYYTLFPSPYARVTAKLLLVGLCECKKTHARYTAEGGVPLRLDAIALSLFFPTFSFTSADTGMGTKDISQLCNPVNGRMRGICHKKGNKKPATSTVAGFPLVDDIGFELRNIAPVVNLLSRIGKTL